MKWIVSMLVFLLSAPAFAAPSLNDLMQQRNIGKPLVSLGLGKPYFKQGAEYTYKIEGCPVKVIVLDKSSGLVSSLSIPAIAACRGAEFKEYFANKPIPRLDTLTYGQLNTLLGEGFYRADCLTGCGNAYDPSVYASWIKIHRPTLTVSTVLVDGDVLDASDKWQEVMEKKYGEDFVLEGKFNCTNEFNPAARLVFQNIKITQLTLGAVPYETRCSRQ